MGTKDKNEHIKDNKKKGYVPIYRSLFDHWLWNDKNSFDVRSAWIDLLLFVNHAEETIHVAGRLQKVKSGQRWTSYCQLAKRWRWSRNRVKRYINLLKSDGMIITDETMNGTLVTIVNYDKYRIWRTTDEPTDGTTDEPPPEPSGEPSGGPQTIMNNKENNDKEVKKEKPPCPGDGYEWTEYTGRWAKPPKR